METATHLGLPWRLLREKLAPIKSDAVPTDVHYTLTLQMLDTDLIKTAHAGSTTVADSLYKNKSSLEVIFRILDKDNSGFISLDEFAEACELLHKHLPEHDTKEQLMEMCKLMDINKDGLVDLNEFLETFRLCEQAKGQCNSFGATNGNVASDGVTLATANDNAATTAPLGSRGKTVTNGLTGIQKQSTDDDEDDVIFES